MKKFLPFLLCGSIFAQNYIFVHGLKSNADTFFKMAGEFNNTIIKIGIEHYNQTGICDMPDGEVNCSDIPSNNTLAKVYGLVDNFDTKFYFKEFNKTDTNLSMDDASLLTAQKFNSNVFIVNLSNNIDLSFEAQGKELNNLINTISTNTNNNNFVLIGHSMGGIAIRAYLEYFYDKTKNINEVITIATPHKGVNYSIPSSIYGASSENLESNSEDIQKLNLPANVEVFNKIPFIAIVSTGYDKFILTGDLSKPDLISGSEDDGVVSADSQTPPFDAKIINVNKGIYHTDETSSQDIIDIVKQYASKYITLHSGWNLIGGDVEAFNLKDINIAWAYNNGWEYYSVNKTLNYPKITETNGGLWIYSDNEREFILIDNDENSTLHTGWNLVKGEINMSNINCDSGNFEIAWKYKNGEWEVYPQNPEYETFDKINKNEGAWILCK